MNSLVLCFIYFFFFFFPSLPPFISSFGFDYAIPPTWLLMDEKRCRMVWERPVLRLCLVFIFLPFRGHQLPGQGDVPPCVWWNLGLSFMRSIAGCTLYFFFFSLSLFPFPLELVMRYSGLSCVRSGFGFSKGGRDKQGVCVIWSLSRVTCTGDENENMLCFKREL